MADKSHDCVPAKLGYYWATDTVNDHRHLVKLGEDGNGHIRVFVFRRSRGYNPQEFRDFVGPIREKRRAQAVP